MPCNGVYDCYVKYLISDGILKIVKAVFVVPRHAKQHTDVDADEGAGN